MLCEHECRNLLIKPQTILEANGVLKFYDFHLGCNLEAKNDNKDLWRRYCELFSNDLEAFHRSDVFHKSARPPSCGPTSVRIGSTFINNKLRENKDRGLRTPAMVIKSNKFKPGRGDLWDLALTTYFWVTGGEHLTRELGDPFNSYYAILKELHRWFSKSNDKSRLVQLPQAIREFILHLLRIDKVENFESWDEVLEIVANLETTCC